jgi:tRNA1(Val) A37 N6-methylase TrmN6
MTLRDPGPDVSDDAILDGRLRLFQPKRGHRFGHDAILLAAAVPAKPGQRVAEFGAGVGAAALALLARVPGIDATLIEIDAGLCALAKHNIARNGFSDRARVLARDVAAPPAERGAFDHIFMNPPFNTANHQPSPDPGRRQAHAAPSGLLQQWIEGAHIALRGGGTLTLISRADGLADVIDALAGGFGGVAILPVYPSPGRPAVRLLAQAQKGSRAALRITPSLTLNDAALRSTTEAEAILRQGAALPLSDGLG